MLRDKEVEKAYAAFQKFRSFTQEQVDRIVDRMAAAGRANAERLARLAVEETGYGNVKDKTAKNLLCSDTLYQAIRPLKTVGIIREDPARKLIEIAEPVGVVAAIIPTTNPTSTAYFKILIALKGRNTIVMSPHPRAVRCTCEAAAVLYQAALEAGAPEDVVQCLENPTLEATNEIMRHRRTGVILSTGGQGIVRAAYSSGKPAIGVGPGNVPVLLERSADVKRAVRLVVEGKSFDYGTVCSSEQSLVAEEALGDQVLAELQANHAYLCDAAQAAALAKLLITPEFRVNPQCVGQPATRIAQMAGFNVPADTAILVVRLEGMGKEHPLSAEKLSPVLSLYIVKDFGAGAELCEKLLHFGGLGHTCVIYSEDDVKVREFALRMPAMRVLVNTPAPQGSTGITTNVFPSMTLGCGAIAGNITSDNIGPLHLINIKRVAWHVREAAEAFASPEGKAYFTAERAESAAKHPESRPALADAVQRYLASRGITASAPAPRASVVASPAAEVVDRFLSSRRQTASNPAPAPAANPSPPPPAPPVEVAGFVSESDVRQAQRAGRKIFINAKTIVTPAARDLGADILVKTD
ncbi:MAG TPA: aldehyde dehydrogenase family protein [Bryobacterales bacterium]|nr:aldehyde dehydrogenase family protein [Bryobacterales bacterium]